MQRHEDNRFEARFPPLGVGITYSSAIEPLLAQHPGLFDVVEVEPQTTWIERRDAPERYRLLDQVLEHLVQLPGRKLVHSIGAPVGGTVQPDPAQLALLRRMLRRFGTPYITEHLSFNAIPEHSTGFLLPPRQTEAGAETVVRNIRSLQLGLETPVAVETGVNYLRPRRDEMDDGAFVAAVIEGADCGLLLDLHNVYTNSVNRRQSLEDYLAQLPLDRVWEVHLAGGFELDGYWLDAHSGAIPDVLFQIARDVVPALPNLKAIIFEIFPSFVPVFGLDAIPREIERLHELWTLRPAVPGHTAVKEMERPKTNGQGRSSLAIFPQPRRWPASRAVADSPCLNDHPPAAAQTSGPGPSPAEWEQALGLLSIGRSIENGAATDLAADPGVAVVVKLIHEFRASMIVSVLPLTSRLMMLALGANTFRMILEDFWSKTPPHQFASSEAEEFAIYLEALDLKVPHLAKVLEFERAAVATLTDAQARVVAFDVDPLPMLRALAEGHLPEMVGRSGAFEIEITPDSVAASMDAVLAPLVHS